MVLVTIRDEKNSFRLMVMDGGMVTVEQQVVVFQHVLSSACKMLKADHERCKH